MCGGDLYRDIAARPVRRSQQDGTGERAGSGASLHDREVVGPAHANELGLDPIGKDSPEEQVIIQSRKDLQQVFLLHA